MALSLRTKPSQTKQNQRRVYKLMDTYTHTHSQAGSSLRSCPSTESNHVKKRSKCCCTVFSSRSSRSVCQRVCLLLALERELGGEGQKLTLFNWRLGIVLPDEGRRGGGDCVSLCVSPPLHICCFFWDGVRVWRVQRGRVEGGGGVAEHSFLLCALRSEASQKARHHSQETERVSVLRSG